MDNDLWQYISRLELMAFFTGYPLVYAFVMVFFENKKIKQKEFAITVSSLLPYAYALTGTLYIGMVLHNLYPDYSIKNIEVYFDPSYLKAWAILSILFWIPLMARRPVISLLHSLVFFILLIKDIFLNISTASGHDMIKNEIKVYSDSLLLNIFTLIAVVLLFFLIKTIRNKKSSL